MSPFLNKWYTCTTYIANSQTFVYVCHAWVIIFYCALFSQQSDTPVSPGPMRPEKKYLQMASDYILPEYTTGFLLAKDISMTFRGVDSSTTSHALQTSASGSMSGSYGPFSASGSFSYGHKSSSLKVSSNSDGLQINIPGAQIIGYYTSLLAKFPQ